MFSSSPLWIGDLRKTIRVKIEPIQSRIFHLLQLDKVEQRRWPKVYWHILSRKVFDKTPIICEYPCCFRRIRVPETFHFSRQDAPTPRTQTDIVTKELIHGRARFSLGRQRLPEPIATPSGELTRIGLGRADQPDDVGPGTSDGNGQQLYGALAFAISVVR